MILNFKLRKLETSYLKLVVNVHNVSMEQNNIKCLTVWMFDFRQTSCPLLNTLCTQITSCILVVTVE